MPLQNSQATFLLLPLELRLCIYEYIFPCESLTVPYDCHKPSVPSSILRTCKQIHQEASPTLYLTVTFWIADPERAYKWFMEIGRVNIKLLTQIHFSVSYHSSFREGIASNADDLVFWYKVLDLLAREATGLRHVQIHWSADPWTGYGRGKDLRFVRELAKIQGLKSMALVGFYGMHWPRYLTEKMGVAVEEVPYDESWLPRQRRFQQSTKDLIP